MHQDRGREGGTLGSSWQKIKPIMGRKEKGCDKLVKPWGHGNGKIRGRREGGFE